jgi:threonine/homoserine/homoserine lactone efflux protein
MGTVIVALLPLIIGSALVPVQIIIDILLLKNPKQGLLKASAYVGGMTTMRLLQGLIFGLILTGSASDTAEASSGNGPVVSTLLMVLGIFFLITAYRQWRKDDDPDAPPPKWLAMIDSLTPLKAFGIGFGLLLIGAKFWVFTLTALAVIGEAQLGQPTSTLTYLLFILLAESLLLIPIIVRVVSPGRSRAFLDGTSDWLTRHNRIIVIAVSVVFGCDRAIVKGRLHESSTGHL